jgi:hypothetical protein
MSKFYAKAVIIIMLGQFLRATKHQCLGQIATLKIQLV